MKKNAFFKVWNLLYPILLYYVVSNIVIALAVMALGINEDTYAAHYTMLQTIAAAVCLPVLYRFYRSDQLMNTVFQQRMRNAREEERGSAKWIRLLLSALCGALAGVALNNLIGAVGLVRFSPGYQQVTAHFFAGDLLFELLGLGILVPVVEELLYRGIVYGRLCDWVGIQRAALLSALIFGGLHGNVVQLLYAGSIGLLLVFFLEKSHSLSGAIAGHIGANLLTVLRVETGMFRWMEQSRAVFWGVTLLMAAACAGLLWLIHGGCLKKPAGQA